MLVRPASGDLRLVVTFGAGYADQYDQAGAVLRIDARTWIKAGIELVDGRQLLSAVVTRDVSDWSVLPLAATPERVTLELRRAGDAVTVTYGLDGAEASNPLRLAYFPPGPAVLAGAMCAAPQGGGFDVRFDRVSV